MRLPAWVFYLTLAVIAAASVCFPPIGAAIAACTATFAAVRLAIAGVKPFSDELELF